MLSLTINKKLFLAIGLVSAVALLVTAIVTFGIVSFAIEEQTKESLVNETIVKGEAVELFLNSKITHVQNIAKNQIIQKTVNEINQLNDTSTFQMKIEERKQVFSDEIAEFQLYNSERILMSNLHVLGKNGKTIFSMGNIDEKQQDYNYTKVKNIKKQLIDFTPYTNSSNGNMIVAVPIFVSGNTNAESIGIIVAAVDISEVSQILHRSFISSNFDKSFLLNKDHVIISKSKSEENVSKEALNTHSISACIENGQNYYGKYTSLDQEKVYGFSYCINNFNVVLLTEINEDTVLNTVTDLQKTFLIIGLTTIAGIGVISFRISALISQPIMKLKDAANEIANGNFDVKTKIKSGDEIEQLSTSFDVMTTKIQEYLEKIKQKDTVIKKQREHLLKFYESRQECCVAIVDIVNSTKITANLSDTEISNFYGNFINFMASIITEFGAIVVKNIGDSILFYFPDINRNDRQSFENVIDCCMKMIDSHDKINDKMDECGLASFSYRISAVYGSVMVAQMSTSSVVDIFGSTVNVCSKINLLAKPNELVIGEDLYDIVRTSNKFAFKYANDYFLNGNKKFSVYSVHKKKMAKIIDELT